MVQITNVQARLKTHLLTGGSITGLQALEKWQTLRLSSYINRLRRNGMNIKTKMVTKKGKTFAKYSL